MTTARFVIDTNVVVAGLLSSSQHSPTVAVVDAMLSGDMVFVLSPALLAEYREVLLRPKLRKLHKLSEIEVDQVLQDWVLNALWVEPPTDRRRRAPDSGDQHLWNLLAAIDGAVLVTGDLLLIQSPHPDARVISPAQCVALLSR